MSRNLDRRAYQRLQFTQHDHGVLLITLSNEGKLNATDARMHAELATIFRDIGDDDSISAVVVTGAEVEGRSKAFSAGGDLDWIAKQVGNHAQTMSVMKEAGDIVRTMIDCDTPIISAINGVAVGAGLAVALMADISIIDEAARFTDGHIRSASAPATMRRDLAAAVRHGEGQVLPDDERLHRRPRGRADRSREQGVPRAEVLPEALRIAEQLATPDRATRRGSRSGRLGMNTWLRQALRNFEASLAYEIADLPRRLTRRRA
jgi:enoyl-CoA hydratase